jgi:hypothetical protein
VSRELLKYLVRKFPFFASPKGHYGAKVAPSPEAYKAALDRLEYGAGMHP